MTQRFPEPPGRNEECWCESGQKAKRCHPGVPVPSWSLLPCPCGSASSAAACCLTPTTWVFNTEPSSIYPPSPKTGHGHPKCFLAASRDCDDKITAEHYVSRTLLKKMESPVSYGLKFSTGRGVGIESLTAKILCARHNAALSPLDASAALLFDALRAVDGHDPDLPKHGPAVYLINGNDIERWLLKVLVGISRSGALKSGRRTLLDTFPWVEILSGSEWPSGSGMTITPNPDGQVNYAGSSFGLTILEDAATNVVHGMRFEIAGITGVLALGALDEHKDGYRASGLLFNRPGHAPHRAIVLGWTEPSDHGFIHLTRVGSYKGNPPHHVSAFPELAD